MGLYEELDRKDMLKRVMPLLQKGGYNIDPITGKIVVQEYIAYNLPWIIVKSPKGMNCRMWSTILFNHFADDMKQPPSRCQDCWKVVIRPTNIVELFGLLALMKDVLAPQVYGCKCGVELREYVHGLYGGYIYGVGLEQGKRQYELARKEVSEKLGEHIPVILKRACTEFEQKFGDSAKWYVTPEQLLIEKSVYDMFDPKDVEQHEQPNFIKQHIMKKWIKYACAHGDEHYLKLVDKPLHAKYVKYHEDMPDGFEYTEPSFEGAI